MRIETIRGDAAQFIKECELIAFQSAHKDRMPTRSWRRVFTACRQQRTPNEVLTVSCIAAGRCLRYLPLHRQLVELNKKGDVTTEEILLFCETVESYRAFQGANTA